jgi:hypothetical protein
MLDVHFRGLKASSVALTSFTEAKGYVNCNFVNKKIFHLYYFSFLVIETLDPDWYSAYNAGSGSNED